MIVKFFVRIVRTVFFYNLKKKDFEKNIWKKYYIWLLLGLIETTSGYVSRHPAIRFWCYCTWRTLLWFSKTIENFVWIVKKVVEKIEKSPKMAVFWYFQCTSGFVSPTPALWFSGDCDKNLKKASLVNPGLLLGMFFRSQLYKFDVIAHIGT